jgi:hypothetical protein
MGRVLYCFLRTSPICESALHEAKGIPRPWAREHSVFNYTRQFNTLAQYGSYHVDTYEKKANLYHEGLTVHLQECLGLSPNLSYNELASAAIDQERLMKAIAEADEKKRKKMMPGSASSGSSTGAPPKYHMVYTPPGGQLHWPHP